MRFTKGKKIGITAAVLIVLVLASIQLTKLVTFANPVSADEASKLVKDRYNGNIVNISTQDNKYKITIELDTGTYVVEVNRNTGDVENLTRTGQSKLTDKKEKTEAEIIAIVKQQKKGAIQKLEKKVENTGTFYYVTVQQGEEQTIYKMDAISGEIVNSNKQNVAQPNKPSSQILTKEDAARIALQKVNGEVDDIDIEQSNGLTYFLVEVKQKHAKDATVQINAISGEVMSITWED